MKIFSYKQHADRIAWERERKRDALRGSILSAVVAQLRQFKPNTCSNIKHPWKLNDRYTARAWCPLHDGRWSKLIVKVGEHGQVTYECYQGCAHEAVTQFVKGRTRAAIIGSDDAIAPATSPQSPVIAGNVVYDATHLFRRQANVETPNPEDYPAA